MASSSEISRSQLPGQTPIFPLFSATHQPLGYFWNTLRTSPFLKLTSLSLAASRVWAAWAHVNRTGVAIERLDDRS